MNRYIHFLLIVVCLHVFSKVRSQNQAPVEINPLVNIDVTGVNTDSFPNNKLYIQINAAKGMGLPGLDKTNFLIEENGTSCEILAINSFATQPTNYSVLLMDHSREMGLPLQDQFSNSVPQTRLLQAQAASMILLGSMEGTNDSLTFMGFANDVDMLTEMDHSVRQLAQVYDEMQVSDTEPQLYHALHEAISTLKDKKGSKIISAIIGGQEENPIISIDSILTLTHIHSIRINIVALGNADTANIRTLASQSGGNYMYANNVEELRNFFNSQIKPREQAYELLYRSPNPAIDTVTRSVVLDVNGQNLFLANGLAAYQLKSMEDINDTTNILFNFPAWMPQNIEEAQAFVDQYALHLGGALLGLILLIVLIKIMRRRADANLIVPAITKIPEEVVKNSMRVRIASPYKDKPAKFTIYSAGGKPIKDFIFKGTRRRARIKLKDLPDGSYKCNLANGGHLSESRSFRLQRKK